MSRNLSKANIQSIKRVDKGVYNIIFGTNYTNYEEPLETFVKNARKSEKMIRPYVSLTDTERLKLQLRN